jgi:hypothetical protein
VQFLDRMGLKGKEQRAAPCVVRGTETFLRFESMGLKAQGLAASRADGLVRYNQGLAHIEFLGQAAAMDGGVVACRLASIEGEGVRSLICDGIFTDV